jgi:hypothetical protein
VSKTPTSSPSSTTGLRVEIGDWRRDENDHNALAIGIMVAKISKSELPARKNRPGDFSQNTNKFVSNHKFGRLNGRK